MHFFAICDPTTPTEECEHAYTLALKYGLLVNMAGRSECRGDWERLDWCDAHINEIDNELHELGWELLVDDGDESIVGIIKKNDDVLVYRDLTARQMKRHPEWKWLDR